MTKKFLKFLYLIYCILLLTGCSSQLNETDTAVNEPNVQTAEETVSDSSMEVHFIDVGQGDCTLIRCDGQSLLIDAGNNSKGTAIQLYLQKQGIKELDYIVGTHPDADHIGGLDVILYKFDCKTIILPDSKKNTRTYDDVIQTMKRKNYNSILPKTGNEYSVGAASFEIIAPNNKHGDNANNISVSILLSHGNNRFIFTGDAEEESESDMLENGQSIAADVYKVSHHGSKTATTQEFLDNINPEYAVISCGDENSYGHPHAQTLNRLYKKNIKMFRTDKQGSIVAASDGSSITWNNPPSGSWTAGNSDKSAGENVAPVKTPEKSNNPVRVHADTTYVINTNTNKFHLPNCSSIKDMADKNRFDSVQSREEIVRLHYAPCGRCKP